MKIWMMTGCSSGLGKQLMLEALKLGNRVAACVRRIETLEPFVRDYPEQLLPVALDVTSPQMIEAAVQRIGTHFNTIDGLINNAGYGYRAAIEEGEDAAFDTLFQTNFFGPMRLIRQVLPIMRKQKSGVIINISSAAAVNTFPGFGYYGASKCALEGASSALAKECAPLGIWVMVVEPGAFRTDFSGRSLTQSACVIEDYAATAGLRRIEHDHTHSTQMGDPQKGAALILEAALSADAPHTLVLGADAWEVVEQSEAQLHEEMARWLKKSRATAFSSEE